MDAEPVTVIVPTLGREGLLRDCLESLAACRPGPGEILLVDQSGGPDVDALAAEFAAAGARSLRSGGRGISRAMNEGMAAAAHDRVAVTHDDCVVAEDWVGRAVEELGDDRDLIVTGRVKPGREGVVVPSTIDDPNPRDYTGELHSGPLFPNNMAFWRGGVIAAGGFDERLWYAEDNDLAYRWLRAGRRLRYRPSMVVWHRDWRSDDALARLWIDYWHAQGVFYAKHLRGGDRDVLRFLARDGRGALSYAVARARRRTTAAADSRSGIARGLVPGLVAGARRYARSSR